MVRGVWLDFVQSCRALQWLLTFHLHDMLRQLVLRVEQCGNWGREGHVKLQDCGLFTAFTGSSLGLQTWRCQIAGYISSGFSISWFSP